jgi:ubiquinone/menaquinone biosynthesis C-methylase UbiE
VSAAGTDRARFVPAAGRRGLTRFYDTVLAITTREGAFRSRLESQLLAGLPTGATILDVGAGTGTLAIALAEAAPGARVVAIEPDPEARRIAIAKTGAERVEWRTALASELPVEDGSCERVAMSLVLHHLDADGKRAALGEARRVLAPGGSLHVADWGRAHDPLMRAAFFVLQLIDGFPGTSDHAAGRLPRFIEDAGFARLETHDRLRTAWGSLELLGAERPA